MLSLFLFPFYLFGFVELYLGSWNYTSFRGTIPRFVELYLGSWNYTSVRGTIPRFVGLYLGSWDYTSVRGTIPRFRGTIPRFRGTIPRFVGLYLGFRYDKLMYLAWRSFLPLSLNYLLV
jgi:NADH:ubiquinone oxidoreductase subunit H